MIKVQFCYRYALFKKVGLIALHMSVHLCTCMSIGWSHLSLGTYSWRMISPIVFKLGTPISISLRMIPIALQVSGLRSRPFLTSMHQYFTNTSCFFFILGALPDFVSILVTRNTADMSCCDPSSQVIYSLTQPIFKMYSNSLLTMQSSIDIKYDNARVDFKTNHRLKWYTKFSKN